MRFAVLADIHGNPLALDAMLTDVTSVGVDGYLVLGDIAPGGYDPAGAVERLRALPNAHVVRGNGEAMLAARDHVRLVKAAAGHPDAAAKALVLASVLAWTHGHLAARGHLDWIAGLPRDLRLTLPDGTRLLAVYATPGSDGTDGRSTGPAVPDETVRAQLDDCGATLVCVGHSHWAEHRTFDTASGEIHLLNPGSVSNPWAPDLRASWALLDATAHGFTVEHRRVAYDIPAVLDALYRSGQPTPDNLALHFRGEFVPRWLGGTPLSERDPRSGYTATSFAVFDSMGLPPAPSS